MLIKIIKKIIQILSLLLLCMLFVGCKKATRRNIAVSEPLEKSQITRLTIESKHLDKKVPYIVYLPKGYGDATEYPVWYGLHSYSTNETMWINNGIADAADELIDKGEMEPLIMVFPFVKDASLKEIEADLEDDGKLDERNVDKFISKELIPYIDSQYFTDTSQDGRYIGGFSMGGMLALRIAFHHTDLFTKVGGYSAGVLSNDFSDRQLEKWLFPNDNIDEIDDVVAFADKKGFTNLKIYLDAGNSNDPFTVGLQSLYEALQLRNISSEFTIYDGGHSLQTDFINDYLKFYTGIE
ncbi:MAG: alpha/beta hydrolase-fold protein [Herbinix sp.]|nr:alpha/beta hydrolase-fold protein [Herbinix sp.]